MHQAMGKKKSKKRVRRTTDQLIADLEAEIERLRSRVSGQDQFSAEDLAEDRARLELSAADYGRLIGVSGPAAAAEGVSGPRNESITRSEA